MPRDSRFQERILSPRGLPVAAPELQRVGAQMFCVDLVCYGRVLSKVAKLRDCVDAHKYSTQLLPLSRLDFSPSGCSHPTLRCSLIRHFLHCRPI